MLKKMQASYADKPVRFLLVPCNQFGAQEPAPNAGVKEFAEKSVVLAKNGAGSNVIMLAKSNLNGVKCTTAGSDVCAPNSAKCCPANDPVYDYLLSATKPGTIKWNFDKIIVGKDGKPYKGETILHGDALEQSVSDIIDTLLADRTESKQIVDLTVDAPAKSSHVFSVPAFLLASACASVLFLARKRRNVARWQEESCGEYYLVA
eukprot:TRINITY_DN1548_c0_g2_i1.p1 TRINITY_DN1548_c0_g2~~TRINITY_DN1548_c0_g2_i1.p1  ORF type:complete len:205 (-),score=41.44 TRINITY_DN1548_c0_g2_i1:381-995(-)